MAIEAGMLYMIPMMPTVSAEDIYPKLINWIDEYV